MIWSLSWRADPHGRRIADRHYNRQSIGANQFVPPGRCLVLTAQAALWITSWPFAEYVKHRWPGAWVCSAFRNEGAGPSRALIVDAVAATLWRWPAPALGMVTFIDRNEVQPERMRPGTFRKLVAAGIYQEGSHVLTEGRHLLVWGGTWMRVGFRFDGETEGRLLAFRMHPRDMPEPAAPLGSNVELAL
jgi:hypothetical protein